MTTTHTTHGFLETGHQHAARIDTLASALLSKADELQKEMPCTDYDMQEALLLAAVRYLGPFYFSVALDRLMPSSRL